MYDKSPGSASPEGGHLDSAGHVEGSYLLNSWEVLPAKLISISPVVVAYSKQLV